MTANAQAKTAAEGTPATEHVSEIGRVGKNLASLGAGQLFTWTMTLAWTLVVPRILGPSGIGMITTGIAVAGLLQLVLGAGTGVYVARETIVSPRRGGRLLGSAMVARLLLTPAFMAAIVIWAQVSDYSPEGKLVLYLSGGATVLYLLTEPAQSYFQATERMHYRALGDAINKAAQGLFGIALTLAGLGVLGFASCWLVMSGVVLVLSLRWARRHVRIEWRTSWQDLRDIARGSVVYWTAGVFYMIYLWIDTTMLSVMTNSTVVGWYGVPTKLFQTMLFIPTLFTMAWLPRLVRAAERSQQDLHEVSRTPVALVLSLAVPIASLVAVSSSELIHLVYGPAYARAVPVLIVLGITLIPMYLNIVLCQVCVAANRQGRWNWLMIGACVLNPALNAVLIPLTQHRFHNGAAGAAIALLATEVAIACGGVVVTGRQVIGPATLRRLWRVSLASAGMWAIVYLMRGTRPILALAAGYVGLIAFAWLCGAVTKDERHQLARWISRKAPTRLRQPFKRIPRRRTPQNEEILISSSVPNLSDFAASGGVSSASEAAVGVDT
jgi:O-antigen/teichoic acid export membrane protein